MVVPFLQIFLYLLLLACEFPLFPLFFLLSISIYDFFIEILGNGFRFLCELRSGSFYPLIKEKLLIFVMIEGRKIAAFCKKLIYFSI